MLTKNLLSDWANISGVDPSLAAENMCQIYLSEVTFGIISGSNHRFRFLNSDTGRIFKISISNFKEFKSLTLIFSKTRQKICKIHHRLNRKYSFNIIGIKKKYSSRDPFPLICPCHGGYNLNFLGFVSLSV
jgi:hypothetical protein